MKKTICVDATDILTKGKEYVVESEFDTGYNIKTDIGVICTYGKSRFRPVPEAEFQYGQEVEWNDCGTWRKSVFCCISPNNNAQAILEVNTCRIYYVSLSNIRPVQSVRDKVIEILKCEVLTIDNIADRIIELVKNEKI